MSLSRKSAAGTAFLGSLLLHFLALLLAAVVLAWGILNQPEAEAAEDEGAYVYITPEMVEEVMEQSSLDDDPNQYIRTTQNTASDIAPEKAAFVSDRDTNAAAEQVSDAGEVPLPTQDGVDVPTNELADRNFKDGEIQEDASSGEATPMPDGAAPAPDAPEVVQQPEGKEVPEEVDSPLDEKVAELLNAVEATAVKKGEEEVEPVEEQPTPEQTPSVASKAGAVSGQEAVDNVFQPETRKNKVEGTISNRGDAAVDAKATPIGRYMREVTSTVEKRWHLLRKQNADFVTYGNLRVRFHVNRSGKAEDIDIVSKDANAVMADFTLKAVLEAEIPPMPEDIVGILEGERLEITYDIIIY